MNSEHTIKLALTILLAAVVAACGPVKKQTTQRASDSEPYQLKSEGEIPPVDQTDVVEEADVDETPVEEDAIDVEDAEAHIDSTAMEPTAALIDGFRVQVFVSVSEDVAQNAAEVARERLATTAYVKLIDGMHKVQVGDCATREEAEALLAHCRETYYKDAWIIECPVRAHRGPAADSRAP